MQLVMSGDGLTSEEPNACGIVGKGDGVDGAKKKLMSSKAINFFQNAKLFLLQSSK